MEEILFPYVAKFNEYLSNYILVFLLVGVGLFYSIKTRFVQIRCFKEGVRNVFGGINIFDKTNSNSMTSFQALSTAIAAQVGTGNIVGASGAILIGNFEGNFLDVAHCIFRYGNNICRSNPCD